MKSNKVKLQGLKVQGKINLDSIGKTSKQVKDEQRASKMLGKLGFVPSKSTSNETAIDWNSIKSQLKA